MKKTAGHCLLFAICISLFGACSKSSGAENNSSYFMTATIDGKAWAANSSNNSYKSPALAGITTSNGVSIVLLLGIKAENKDTSAFALIFPQDITLNQSTIFDPAHYSEGAYISETSPGSASYAGYNTTSQTGGSGSLTISVFDQTNKIIEGTFSGTFGLTTGGSTMTVTNGKFRCPYTTDISQVNNLSGLKF